MSYNSPPNRSSWSRPAFSSGARVGVDFGLRQYMLRVYNFMAAGLGVTGLVAYCAVATGFYQQIAGTPLIWLVMLAPLGAVLFLSFRSLRDLPSQRFARKYFPGEITRNFSEPDQRAGIIS